MGQGFGTVPNSALIGPNGVFVGPPDQVLKHANASLPTSSQMMGGDVMNPTFNQDTIKNIPKIGAPSFQQAAQAGATTPGGVNATSPGLSKAGKLITLLTSGLQGALAGRQAQEQTIAQTGGRRAGGIGTGFEAGFQLPWQRAMQGQQLAQQQAQTGLIQAEQQNVNIPGVGPMPAWLARTMGPAWLRMQGQENVQGQKGQQGLELQNVKNQGAQNVAQINKRFIPVEGVGLFDTQSRSVVPGTNQAVQITPEIAKDYDLPPEFLGKPMKLSDLNAFRFQNVPEMTAQGPVIINRNTAQAQPVQGPGGQRYSPPAMAIPDQVADPNNPGQTIMLPRGQVSGMAGTQSASVQVPKAAAKAEVPSKIGDQKLAFSTALQHADLLTSAINALHNGDQQTLNSLKNRFATEFGSSGPVTAQTIASAYTREVNKMLSGGHMSDADFKDVGSTLNVNRQSPEQSLGVISAYKALAQSKMNMLNQQKQSAINQSQPNGKPSALKTYQGHSYAQQPDGSWRLQQ